MLIWQPPQIHSGICSDCGKTWYGLPCMCKIFEETEWRGAWRLFDGIPESELWDWEN